MKTLTLTALGLAAALTAPMASADTILRTATGSYVVLDEDNHIVPSHATRVVVLPHAYPTVRVVELNRHDSPAEELIELLDDMNDRLPHVAVLPYGYVTLR